MSDIGSQLRAAREARGLSITDIQKATRIKRIYIEAIEAEQFHELPGPIQTRGFIRSYANHLELNADELLAQIGEGREAGALVPPGSSTARSSAPQSVGVPGSRPRDESPAALPLPLPILLIGIIVLFIIGGLLIIQALSAESPAPESTPQASINTSLSLLPTASATPTVVIPNEVSLTLTAREHVWVRVTEDGFTAFEGILQPDEATTWQAREQVIIETGNAAALSVIVNDEPAGVLGPRNSIVIRAWGPNGEVTPAPTAVPADVPALERDSSPDPTSTPET